MNKKLFALASIAVLTLAGCGGSPNTSSQTSATTSTAASITPTQSPEPVLEPGEKVLSLVADPDECLPENGLYEFVSYWSVCGDQEMLVTEVGRMVDKPLDTESVADAYAESGWTGWWAAGADWMILGEESAVKKIAQKNDAELIHTEGRSEITIDDKPYQWEDLSLSIPDDQVYELEAAIEEATTADCDNPDFDFKQGAVASGKCIKDDGTGAFTVGVFKTEKERAKSIGRMAELLKMYGAPYYILEGNTWAIMNVGDEEGSELQEMVGGELIHVNK